MSMRTGAPRAFTPHDLAAGCIHRRRGRSGDHRNLPPMRYWVEAMGIEPTDLLHAMQALYQLSYAPKGARNTTSRHWLLKPPARRRGLRRGRLPGEDRHITPEALEVVEGSRRRVEDVDHEVAVVHQHPREVVQPLDAQGRGASTGP